MPNPKVPLHCAGSRENCLATPCADKSHEMLPKVTYFATAENVARQVSKTVVENSATVLSNFPLRCAVTRARYQVTLGKFFIQLVS